MKHSILIVFGTAVLGAIISASQDGKYKYIAPYQ